ncbi:hypothetical protein D3C86_1566020 [compost metagenome]
MQAGDRQPDRQLVAALARQAQGATVEEIDHAGVAQYQAIGGEKCSVFSEVCQLRRDHGDSGHQPGVGVAQTLTRHADQALAFAANVQVIGCTDGRAAADALGDARVIALGVVALEPLAMAVPGFGSRQPASRVDTGQFMQFRKVEPADAGACLGEQVQGAFEGR